LKTILAKTPVAIAFVAACVLSTGVSAQSDTKADTKRALAVKLAQMQQKTLGPMLTEQLTGGAVQPVLMHWSQQLEETVPQERQKEVREKLDVELKKFTETTGKAIEAQATKTAEAALVPIFMDKLTEDELKTIVTFLESPASAKFQAAMPDAADAWVGRIVDATKTTVENNSKNFDATATRIVGATAGPASGASAPAK
jgi:hypothetical protein